MIDLQEIFGEKYEDEFLKFEKVTNKKHPCPDLHVFLTLDELAPKSYPSGERCDIVAAADHDVIYLATDVEEFAKVATEEQCVDWIRAGLIYDEENDGFKMFA